MWFKNIFVFAFTRSFTWTQEQLEQCLTELSFVPCGSTELSHFGWVNALGKHGNNKVHAVNGNYLLCARKEEKILPAQVIKDLLEERVESLEIDQGRSATKKEKEQFKEDIIFELLPRAFSRLVDTHAYINTEENIIVVNASSRGKAEDFLALLRKTLGTLPVTSFSPERAPDEIMTDWLTVNSDEKFINSDKFTLGMEAEFHALGDDAGVVRVKNEDLNSEEIQAHLNADKFVTKVALEFDSAISFILNDDLSIKRIKFFDVIHEQNDDIDSDDIVAKLDADFALMAGELNRMIASLYHDEFKIDARSMLEESPLTPITINEQASITQQVEKDMSDTDSLIDDVKAFVIETRVASISRIQRKFRIGYNRAARIVELLEQQGVITEPGHNGSIKVLIAA